MSDGLVESLEAEIERLQARVELLEKALRLYANEDNWRGEVIDSYSGEVSVFDCDGDLQDEPYEIAQAALQEQHSE